MEGERLTIKNQNTMTKLNSLQRYLRNLQIRQRASKRITPDGEVLVFYNGTVMSEQAFNDLFPISLIGHFKGAEMIDPRHRLFYS
jgi:hypothetical protein